MKIKLPTNTNQLIGGGISFTRNLKKALKPFGYIFVEDNNQDYDCLFISGATLVSKEDFKEAKEKGKKIILRVDNILEDGKNRNSGMPRLKEYAKGCDVIVYQSEWAKRMLKPLIGDGVVIYNGVDTDIFYPRKEKKDWDNLRILYSKFSRNETKQFHETLYWWREYNLEVKNDVLVLVGKYADDKIKINNPFELHNNELYEYHGVISQDEKLAEIIRSCDLVFLPYMFDACSNTILEAQACGLPIIYSHTGGTPELVDYGIPINYKDHSPKDMVNLALGEKSRFQREDVINKWGLETMGEKYHALFQTISNTKIFEV
jgi:glycosyltransferase involved in cell wall biosynthesis